MARFLDRFRQFLSELRRRNVYKVAAVYGAVAFVVVQAARLLVPAMVLPEWLYRAVVAVALLGFPFVLVFAWAFELTPEGVRQRPVEEGEGGTSSLEDRSPAEPRAEDCSVAVLPFRSLGQEKPSPLGEGMHDALLTQLSKVSGLKVISRTSVQQYRRTKKTTAEIARELGVKWVVEGGVQELENKIQVNAQLIDPRTDTHRWAESYRRDLTVQDLFELQSDLTKHIARSLEAELTSEEKSRVERRPTGSLEAYRLYVRGRQQLARRSFDVEPAATVREAAESFRQAIDQDAEFALAWAGLADAAAAHQRMVVWAQLAADAEAARRIGVADGSPSELPNPEEAAQRALKINPDLAEAHASMGFVYLQNMDAPGALRALHQAIKSQPSYWEAHHWLGELYLKLGQPQRALDHISLAVELNPQHAQARHWLYDAYLVVGQAKKSLKEARRQQQRGLEQKTAVMGEVRALVNLGRLEEARALAEEEISELGVDTVWGRWFRAYRVQILAAQDKTSQAREQMQALQAAEAHPSMIAWAQAGIGEGDQAVATYRKIERTAWGRIGTTSALRYPITYGLSALEDAPGYLELIRDLNQAWGLNPDGSMPTVTDTSEGAQANA